ncbi:hypothetical protein [Streptantibioticus ferralitis]|uniref:Ig-like domain-containing protein n=1 Tax=Streptantibioticus ferralitis TaxID=236510 RepID=A0ABT5Z6D0_9ACTN|nr:hypothetical protein [Streptantibioticus ferralitis]MDF2259390.1 hypothetical protein [Streptantibioticus ferralitis]
MKAESERFAEELRYGLVELAAGSGPPPADLQARVRARVVASRRRRTGVLAGCAAVCVGAALTFGVTRGGGTGSGQQAQPAAQAPPAPAVTGAPAAPAPAGPPSASPAGELPDSLAQLWNLAAGTTHTDVRVLHRDTLDGRSILLVQGRQPDGQTRVALLSAALNQGNRPTGAGTYVLLDRAARGGPSVPVAVTFLAKPTGTRTIVVLPTGCTGQLRLTQQPGGERIDWKTDFTGELVLNAPVLSSGQAVAVSCEAASGASTSVLRFTGSARTGEGSMVSLLTGD